MGGGLLQLVSIGFQDLYLSSDPEITYFKMVYRRHTNFSQEPVVQNFNIIPDFGKRITCSIAHTADLISNIYLHVQLPNIPISTSKIDKFKWVKKIGFALINNVELEINGQLIDKLYGDWMNIWSILSTSNDIVSEDILIGNVPDLYDYSDSKSSYNLYIPINFYFNRNKGLSLPVISLHSSDIKLNVELNKLDDVLVASPSNYIEIEEYIVHFNEGDIIKQNVGGKEVVGIFNYYDFKTNRLYYTKYESSFDYFKSDSKYNESSYKISNSSGYCVMPKSGEFSYSVSYPNLSINKANLIVNFLYLDNLERKKFINSKHEYLISTLQFSGEKTISNIHTKIKLPFINPSKELFWVCQLSKIKNGNVKEKFNYTSELNYSGNNIIEKSMILNNGQVKSSDNNKYFYSYLQSYLHHTSNIEEGINLYSFSLDPENSQPMGTINFSKIDDLSLDLSLSSIISYNNPALLRVYNYNYNILRISNGLGGLAFTN